MDTWARYGVRTFASASGDVVATVDGRAFDRVRNGTVASTVKVSRRHLPGAAAATGGRANDPSVAAARDELWEVVIPFTPKNVVVTEDGRVGCIGNYGDSGKNQILCICSNGQVTRGYVLSSLMPGWPGRFEEQPNGGCEWYEASWLAAAGDHIFVLHSEGGVLSVGVSEAEVWEYSLLEIYEQGCVPVSEYAASRYWEFVFVGAHSFSADVYAQEVRPDLPDSVRVRVVAALADADPEASSHVLKEGLSSSDPNVANWCWLVLGAVLGDEALPFYVDALESDDRYKPARAQGMARIGDSAVSAVVDMLLEPGAGQEGWNVPYVLRVMEARAGCSQVLTCKPDFIDYRIWNEEILALQRLRDLGDVRSAEALLGTRRYSRDGELRYSPFALPALELLARVPVRGAGEILVEFDSLLQARPHRSGAWGTRLRQALGAARLMQDQ